MKLIFTLVCLFFFSISYSQKYKEGKIKFKNGDIVSGFLKEASLKSMCKSIVFKSSLSSSPTVYSTSELISFEFGTQLFINQKINETLGNRFLLVLITGKFGLLRDDEIFYVKNSVNEETFPLIRTEERLIREKYINVDMYKYQLDSLCRECSTMSSPALRINYTDNDLSKLIEKLNNCLGDASGTNFIKKMPKPVRSFGIRGIGGVSRLNYVNNGRVIFSTPTKITGSVVGMGIFFTSMGGIIGKRRLGTQMGLDIVKNNFSYASNYKSVRIQPSLLILYALSPMKNKTYTFFEAGFQLSKQINENFYNIDPKGTVGYSMLIGSGIRSKLSKRNDLIAGVRANSFLTVFVTRTTNVFFSGGITF